MMNENKPDFAGEVEDWVTQDLVPRRAGIDQYRWVISKNNMTSSWGMTPDGASESMHGHIDQYGARLELRCRRMDYPVVNPNDWVTQDVVHDRPGIDQWRWVSPNGTITRWFESCSGNDRYRHGRIHPENSEVFEVRCRRKDHPVLGNVVPKLVSQEELNAAPKTRAWTFGKPAQTGHFLLSYKDPAFYPQEIFANTIGSEYGGGSIWFIYLGQTSDFADPVVPKAKYTLLMDPNKPKGHWYRRPEEIQEKLNLGWTIVKEQEYEIPEWDR